MRFNLPAALIPRPFRREVTKHQRKCDIAQQAAHGNSDPASWSKVLTFLHTERTALLVRIVEAMRERLGELEQLKATEGGARYQPEAELQAQRLTETFGILRQWTDHLAVCLRVLPSWDDETKMKAVRIVSKVDIANSAFQRIQDLVRKRNEIIKRQYPEL